MSHPKVRSGMQTMAQPQPAPVQPTPRIASSAAPEEQAGLAAIHEAIARAQAESNALNQARSRSLTLATSTTPATGTSQPAAEGSDLAANARARVAERLQAEQAARQGDYFTTTLQLTTFATT